MVLAIAGFILLGSLRVGAGNWMGRQMPVREIWSRYVGYLTDQGASTALVVAVTAAAVVALIAAAVGLGLALGLRDDPGGPLADESVGK
jgi:ABC-type sulfate transport system permease component